MYNPFHYQQFGGYYQQPAASTLPQQQIIQVSGKASVDSIQLAPNSSILLMDTTAPVVWMCVSDGVGKVTSKAYDITEHKEKPPVDVESIEDRIRKIEKTITEMEEKINVKSYGDSVKSKQDLSRNSASQKNDANA